MEKKTKLSLLIGSDTVSWENSYTDNTLEDLFEAFEGLLVTHTFAQESIHKFIIEKAEGLKEIYKYETEN